jgi:formylglycine-generating enzyme required for sulfatase activity
MKHILNLALFLTFALAQTASARIDLLWEIPLASIPNFVNTKSGPTFYGGGKDGSLAFELRNEGAPTRIAWFNGSGNVVSIIDISTIRGPGDDRFIYCNDFLFTSSASLIANFEQNSGVIQVVVFTKTEQGLKNEFFSYSAQPNFTSNDNALIRFEDGKLKRYRFVDDQPVAPASQPVLGSVKTNDRYLLLDYAVAPNHKYHLGISKDLKTWEPLYDFTPASGQLSIELPRIILGDHSFLKLDELIEPPSMRIPEGFVRIPAGTFVMGSPATEKERILDETQHTVTLTKDFYMSKHEVTQREYLAVMGNNPSNFGSDLNGPVENVSWNDAMSYCAKLTASEKAAGRLQAGWEYRLPTEAEWEYACRAGTSTPFHYGNDLRSGMANFDGRIEYAGGTGAVNNRNGTYLGRTTTVGSYAANALGLYDMHGNVWEWCLDWKGNYPAGSVNDPKGPSSGSYRVVRGGCWGYDARYCRSAGRGGSYPVSRSGFIGFRPVLAPGQ